MSKTFKSSILSVRDAEGNVTNIPAIKGKSAYEYAKDGGYAGTEAEFARSINPDNLQEDIANLETLLSNILAAIQNGGTTSYTVAEIEQLIVSYFENKSVEEVEF